MISCNIIFFCSGIWRLASNEIVVKCNCLKSRSYLSSFSTKFTNIVKFRYPLQLAETRIILSDRNKAVWICFLFLFACILHKKLLLHKICYETFKCNKAGHWMVQLKFFWGFYQRWIRWHLARYMTEKCVIEIAKITLYNNRIFHFITQ